MTAHAPATKPVQPEQEYIITESMLRIWRNQCIAEPAHSDTDQCKKCQYRGKGARIGCCDFGESDMEKIFRSRPAPSAPECIACPKPAIGYGIGKDEARLTQCNTCMFDGKRECMYHGYPDETIPSSCEYKIGKYAVIAPIEAQLHNREHNAAIRNEVLDEVYNKIDGKRVCKWGESERCEVLDLVESFRTISTTGDKGGE